jgi:hypothetical protein
MTRLLSLAALLLLGLLGAPQACAQAPGDREGLRTGPRAKRDHEIRWREWGPPAFTEAKRADKLVLLDLTATWCHWCHIMDETTYSDPDVIRIVNSRFIPIRVDADRYPQVADRYLSDGWPTTAVLTPEGHVLATRTYVPPGEMSPMLVDVGDLYRRKRGEVDRMVEDLERAVEATWRSAAPDSAQAVPESTIVGRALDALRRAEDRANGGFADAPKFHDADAVTFLLRESRARGGGDPAASALRAVDGALRLEDSVWGGFFRYATKADWSEPHHEKMLDGNAAILRSCAEAYAASGASRYRDAIARTGAYAARWLWDERGGWFGSQDADVGSHDPAAAFWAGEYYYAQDEATRRRLGIPRVDSTLYTAANARMASALIAAVRVGALEERALKRPIEALNRFWRDLRAPDGSLHHAWSNGKGLSPGLLADQVWAGLAYLDAYEATGDTLHLARARLLRDWLRVNLEDPVGGGFRYAVRDTSAVGRVRAGDRPSRESALGATLFLRLHWIDGRAGDLRTAERTAAWLRSGPDAAPEPARALLAARLTAPPVRIAVIGAGGAEETEALRHAAFRAQAPDAVVRLYGRGGPAARWGDIAFPRSPAPALYLCGPRACSPPITDAADVDRKIAAFLKSGSR